MNEERARQGVGHVQEAAIQLIEAARAFLDVLEDLVKDPGVTVRARRPAADDDGPHVEHITVAGP